MTKVSPIPVVIDTSSLVANLRQPTAEQLNLPKLWQQNAIKPSATPETLQELRRELLQTQPINRPLPSNQVRPPDDAPL